MNGSPCVERRSPISLRVIGAGLSRTGTLSLKLALEQLGFGPCYHMLEVIAQPRFVDDWWRAAHHEAMDWDQVFAGYCSAVDLPVAHYYQALTIRYPDAKVILTVRDSESWYRSVRATIFSDDASGSAHSSRLTEVMAGISAHHFGGRIDDREALVAGYERHNDEVRCTIAKDRLLVYRVTEGWGPLCRFLRVPAPNRPFPVTNAAVDFQTAAYRAGSL